MKKETRLIVKCKSCGGHAEAIITRPKPDEEYYFFSCKFCDHTYEMYSIPRINYGKALLKWSRRSKEADHVWSYVILTAKLDETPARYFVLYNQNEIELASEEKGVEIYNNVLSQLKEDE